MIAAPQNIQLVNTRMFTTNEVMGVTTTSILPNACWLEIGVVHRLPSMSLDPFFSVLL